MKGIGFMVVAVLLGAATSASASTRTCFGFQIGIGNAPPPPVVRYMAAPRAVCEPESRVYVVEDNDYDYDMFRYGDSWFLCNEGYWYRAHDYQGPFVAVDVRYVPRPIFYIPANHVRHQWRGGPWWQHRVGRRDFARWQQGDGQWDRGQRGDQGLRQGNDRGDQGKHGHKHGHERDHGDGRGDRN